MTVEYHRRKFETLCNELGDRTDRCTVGFLRRYGKLEDRLAAAGRPLRLYVPFGDDWYGYYSRRLAERPANLAFVLRGLFG